jgi:steroid Delta-isomerase
MTEAHAHINRFNAAVAGGDWAAFLATLHPDAVMTFAGRAAGPFVGRDAIAEAYAVNPPDDTMRVLTVEGDVIFFEWSRGGTGTLTIQRSGDLITSLLIRFD